MNRLARCLSAASIILVIGLFLVLREQPATAEPPAREQAGKVLPQAVESDAPKLPAGTARTLERQSDPAAPAGVRVEPGTPPEYLVPYSNEYTLSEIHADGTQVYTDVPFYVRQEDGTVVTRLVSLSISPEAPLPLPAASSRRGR